MIFINQNYTYDRNLYCITIYKYYFGLHAIVRSVAVTTLLLLAGVVVKGRADRRGSTVHGTAGDLCEFQNPPPRPKP